MRLELKQILFQGLQVYQNLGCYVRRKWLQTCADWVIEILTAEIMSGDCLYDLLPPAKHTFVGGTPARFISHSADY
ncbi:hypothetical protein CT122_12190 [Pseudomonas syringae pv. actinidiae]|uniref:Uncharacterized protein n=1 Tax=Pseudomonas syringae pv. actinidiae TaxID=103796 RepID=A0AAU8XGE3_PSESF|nr:hypothetical protein CT122_12190 [Pseudomonas syringae pv. actinidiae]